MVRILTAAGISAYRLAPPGDDLIVAGVTAEVKRRKDGFRELYKWLESAGVLFMRADRKGWIVAMPIERYKELMSWNGKSPP